MTLWNDTFVDIYIYIVDMFIYVVIYTFPPCVFRALVAGRVERMQSSGCDAPCVQGAPWLLACSYCCIILKGHDITALDSSDGLHCSCAKGEFIFVGSCFLTKLKAYLLGLILGVEMEKTMQRQGYVTSLSRSRTRGPRCQCKLLQGFISIHLKVAEA